MQIPTAVFSCQRVRLAVAGSVLLVCCFVVRCYRVASETRSRLVACNLIYLENVASDLSLRRGRVRRETISSGSKGQV